MSEASNRMKWLHKDLLDVSQLSQSEIMAIFETAGRFHELQERPVKKVPTLKGRSVILFSRNPAPAPRPALT